MLVLSGVIIGWLPAAIISFPLVWMVRLVHGWLVGGSSGATWAIFHVVSFGFLYSYFIVAMGSLCDVSMRPLGPFVMLVIGSLVTFWMFGGNGIRFVEEGALIGGGVAGMVHVLVRYRLWCRWCLSED